MDIDTATRIVDRIVEWSEVTGGSDFNLVVHGGEPTLWPVERLAKFADCAASAPGVDIHLALQTNGVHFTPAFLDVVNEYSIGLGVSVDGPQQFNDAYRLDHAGRGSYRGVMRSVDMLMEHPASRYFGGFLSVVDTAIPPEKYIDWIQSLPKRSVDLIWPMEVDYDRPPWKRHGLTQLEYSQSPVYGDWMTKAFDLWFDLGDPGVRIMMFEEIIRLLVGVGGSHSDDLVNRSLSGFVINSSGSYEYHDYVRNAYDGACRTGLDVTRNSFAEFMRDPVLASYLSLDQLIPSECAECPVIDVCGGGFVTGRLSASSGRPMPVGRSVLCFDHYSLITHIIDRIAPVVSTDIISEFSPEAFSMV
ncbi:hypothetical protein A8M60_03440 [Nocardia farcinica]|nr:hypothetical protein A8M60_03440 [Nocardia farcinica]